MILYAFVYYRYNRIRRQYRRDVLHHTYYHRWRSYIHTQQHRRSEFEYNIHTIYNKQLYIQTLNAWRRYISYIHYTKHIQYTHKRWLLLAWKLEYTKSAYLRLKLSAILHYFESQRLSYTYKHWKIAVIYRPRIMYPLVKKYAFIHWKLSYIGVKSYRIAILRKVHRSWKGVVKRRKADVNRALYRQEMKRLVLTRLDM